MSTRVNGTRTFPTSPTSESSDVLDYAELWLVNYELTGDTVKATRLTDEQIHQRNADRSQKNTEA